MSKEERILATTENGLPRVRPFGFRMLYEGRLYFGMGSYKPSYRQVIANPNVELCRLKPDGSFIRVRGKAVFDMREQTQAEMFRVSPGLYELYNDTTGRCRPPSTWTKSRRKCTRTASIRGWTE